MKKWLIIGAAVIAIIIAVLLIGISNLGPLIKNAVNTYGPKMTRTEVQIDDVRVSILSGQATLKDFHLGNPQGFKTSEAMSVGSIHVKVDKESLTKDTIVIDKVEVVRPEIAYEKSGGTDNFKVILNNVNRAVGVQESARAGTKQEEKAGGKKLLIRDFTVRDGKVTLAIALRGGKSITAPLPDIHLMDVGSKKGGASPADVFKEIFSVLHAKITSPAVTDTLNRGLKELRKGAGDLGESAKEQVGGLGKEAKKGIGGVTDQAKGLFGK